MIKLSWQEQERVYLLTLDAVLSEQYDLDAQVTTHPIEQGSPLTDHVRALPIRISLEGVVTDTPIYLPSDHTDGMVSANHTVETRPQTLADAIENQRFTPGLGQSPLEAQIAAAVTRNIHLPAKKGFVRTFVGDRQRLVTDTLLRLRDKALLLSVETKLRRFNSMVLASASVRRQGANQHLRVNLTLQEVQGAIVSALEVVPQVSTKRVQKPRTQPVETPVTPPADSALFRMGRALGAL